jgi:hypothetical protein
MALAGKGAVAIWHDIAHEGREPFYAWHGQEHMPERLAIPGFLRGRRYVAIEGAPEFFNLYETASTAVLTGPAYLARLNAPTPWTVATVQHFRHVARSLCDVALSIGDGLGGLCATFRYDIDDGRAGAHRVSMGAALRDLARTTQVAAAHLLVADEAASAIETAERRARGGERNAIPRWIVLVEGWGDTEPFVAACRAFAASGAFEDVAVTPDFAAYRLQNQRDAVTASAAA